MVLHLALYGLLGLGWWLVERGGAALQRFAERHNVVRRAAWWEPLAEIALWPVGILLTIGIGVWAVLAPSDPEESEGDE